MLRTISKCLEYDKTEIFFAIYGAKPTDTGAETSLDFVMIGGIAAGGIVVVAVIVLLTKRKR